MSNQHYVVLSVCIRLCWCKLSNLEYLIRIYNITISLIKTELLFVNDNRVRSKKIKKLSVLSQLTVS